MAKVHFEDREPEEAFGDEDNNLPPCPPPLGSSFVAQTAGPLTMAPQALGESESTDGEQPGRGVSARYMDSL